MCSRKSAGTRMEPWETPALIGNSFEDFPSRTTQSSLTEKRRNKVKYLTWNSKRLKFVKKPTCQTLSKVLDITSATAWGTTVRRSIVDQEDLKPWLAVL